MNRDKTHLWSYYPETIKVTAENAADWIMSNDSGRQAALFACMAAKLVDNDWPPGGWAMQCRGIANELTNEECDAVRSMLETLVEHLAAIPVERKATALSNEIFSAVDALAGNEVGT